MARNVQVELEHEADKKGLTGERREAYIGGAWQNIRHGEERRGWWRTTEEHRVLSRLFGEIQDLRQPKSKPDSVYFRQGKTWYELASSEYWRLVGEGQKVEREDKRQAEQERKRKAHEDRLIAQYKRAEEKERAQAERDELRKARQLEQAQQAEQRQLDAIARAEHHEVLAIVRRFGGIRRGKTASGKETERGEYNRLPTHVRARTRLFGDKVRGLTADEAATAINQHMPWLKLETPDDLYNYFERVEDRRNNRKAS